MIEVFQVTNGWRWRMICASGRELMASAYVYKNQSTANRVAKRLRAQFFNTAATVDFRQGASL